MKERARAKENKRRIRRNRTEVVLEAPGARRGSHIIEESIRAERRGEIFLRSCEIMMSLSF